MKFTKEKTNSKAEPSTSPTLQDQLDAAVADQQQLDQRSAQIAGALSTHRQEVEALAERAAACDEPARARTRELRSLIAELEMDAETIALAGKKKADRVSELTAARRAEAEAEAALDAVGLVEGVLAKVIAADERVAKAVALATAAFVEFESQLANLSTPGDTGPVARALASQRIFARLAEAHAANFASLVNEAGADQVASGFKTLNAPKFVVMLQPALPIVTR